MKHEHRPERAEEFSKMLMNTFRYQLANRADVECLSAVCKIWGAKLELGEYPPSLMSLTLVSSAKVPD